MHCVLGKECVIKEVGVMLLKKKRTKYDAPAPIIKPCFVDTQKIWDSKKTVSQDLFGRVAENLILKRKGER